MIELEGLEPAPTVNEHGYPTETVLKRTMAEDAIESIFGHTEDPDFATDYGITFDELGQDKLAETLLTTRVTEGPQEDRRSYSGKVARVASRRYDTRLISEDNVEGEVPGSFKVYEIPAEFVPENTGSVYNPGYDPSDIPKIDMGDGKSIGFVVEIVIDEPN